MSAAEQAYETAMVNHLRDAGQIEDDEFITHYVLVYATTHMNGGSEVGIHLSGPNDDEGMPPWQAKGLLAEGRHILDAPSGEDDD